MIIPLEKVKQYEIFLSDIKVICQEPSCRVLVNNGRVCNGFICVVKGSCKYEYEGGEFILSEGSAAYLPFGSKHILTVISENICFYRIDFTLRIENEIVLFSDRPMKITDNVTSDCLVAIKELEREYRTGENSLERMKHMCTILSELQKASVSKRAKRLMPAVNHLSRNIFGKVDCGELAKLCFLSTSRFYDLFRAEFGMTPLEYRDRLLLRRAVSLLSEGDLSVSEAAFAVGFENAAYFSRFFKKHMGLSPIEYKRQNK